MKQVDTTPGKTYAVEAVGEVTVTNAETNAVAATGDGSGQVHFTACGVRYNVSDDTAAVLPLS